VGSIRAIFEALEAQIAIEVARPANADNSGGTSFPVEVLFGHEQLSRHQGASGRVVLSLHEDGEDSLAPGKMLNGTLRSLYTWQPALSASLWAPVGAAGERQYLERLDAIESLTRCVLRAIHEQFHGSNMADVQIASGASVVRQSRHLRHGEAVLITFSVGVPITKGRTLTTLPAGTSLAVNLRVNPEE
jgi:hypothetical protein